MNMLFRLFDQLHKKKVDPIGLAIFRITYSLILLMDVIQIYDFRHLIFDKVPYRVSAEIDLQYTLLLWMTSLICIMFGFKTRFMTVLNYVFTVVFISTIKSYEYHMYYVYVGINFTLMFVSLSNSASIDAMLRRMKHIDTSNIKPKKVSVLNYFALVFAGIAIVYFDSVFYKYASPMWLNGLGVWLPSSVPPIVWFDSTPILNQKALMLVLGYAVLAFESVFIFTFFRKKLRLPFAIFGIGLHIGIAIQYPIPWFGFGMITVYLLMIPIHYWRKLKGLFRLTHHKYLVKVNYQSTWMLRCTLALEYLDVFRRFKVNYSADHFKGLSITSLDGNKEIHGYSAFLFFALRVPLTFIPGALLCLPIIKSIGERQFNRVHNRSVAHAFDSENLSDVMYQEKSLGLSAFSKARIVSIGFVLACLFLLNTIYNSALIIDLRENLGVKGSAFSEVYHPNSLRLLKFTKIFFGITGHAVFVAHHIVSYNHNIAVEYTDTSGKKYWLPIATDEGFTDKYQVGPIWAKWGFRINRPNIDLKKLELGLRDFTSYWLYKEEIPDKNGTFTILVKYIDDVSKWERDFLKRQIEREWVKGGYCYWKDNQFYASIDDIESFEKP